jgi:plasmid stability protein
MISTMAQIVVRDLEDSVKQRLKRRAKKNGRSMEDEVRHILRSAVQEEAKRPGLGTRIAARFAGLGLNVGEIHEFKGEAVRPVKFRR